MLIRTLSIFILFFSAFVSLKWMMADFYGERVALSLQKWIGSEQNLDNDIINRHLDFSKEAVVWAPQNARYKELQARLRLMRLSTVDLTENFLVEELNIILDLHREAAIERPQWAFSWASIAYIKGAQGSYDQEYKNSLEKALAFGPYETNALQRLMLSAVANWDRFDPELKQSINIAAVNFVEMTRNRRVIRDLQQRLSGSGALEQICQEATFYSDQSKQRLCGKI